jgi:hypothetical protein
VATGGVASVVFVVVGVSVDGMGSWEERGEWGVSSSSMVMVWGGGRGVMVDVLM